VSISPFLVISYSQMSLLCWLSRILMTERMRVSWLVYPSARLLASSGLASFAHIFRLLPGSKILRPDLGPRLLHQTHRQGFADEAEKEGD
jgi:hypothetical protein